MIGVIVGAAIRIFKKDWGIKLVKYSMTRKTSFWAFGAIFFGFFAAYSYIQGQIASFIFSLVMTCLELYCLYTYGIKNKGSKTIEKLEEKTKS